MVGGGFLIGYALGTRLGLVASIHQFLSNHSYK